MTTIVIGLGNRDRGDDGVGLAVADRLRSRALDAVVAGWDGPDIDLVDLWRDFDGLVLVDAMRSGAPAGTIRRFTRLDPPGDVAVGTSHALGLGRVLELARALGALPARWELHAIEVGTTAHGRTLSPSVASAADELADRLAHDLARRPVAVREGDRRVPR